MEKNTLTDNGLIALILKVCLEENNTNNPIEKWAKNMKYEQLFVVGVNPHPGVFFPH